MLLTKGKGFDSVEQRKPKKMEGRRNGLQWERERERERERKTERDGGKFLSIFYWF